MKIWDFSSWKSQHKEIKIWDFSCGKSPMYQRKLVHIERENPKTKIDF